MRELDRVEGTAGADIQLTIDKGVQNFAMQRMAGESAASVVIDVRNGDLIAMASSPGFDPNSFVFGIASGEWNALLNDEYKPLSNKTVAGAYPPGSTFKMTVALAALEAGVMRPGDTVGCGGGTRLGNRTLPLLEARRPRQRRPAPQPVAVLRLLLLRDGPPGRSRRHLGDGEEARDGCAARPADARRSPRA